MDLIAGSAVAAFVASGLDYETPHPRPEPPSGALVSPPVELWSRQLPGNPPGTATRSELATPVVDGDRIYVGYSGANGLLVLDRQHGSLLTTLPTHAPVVTAPVLSDTFLFVTDSAGYTQAFRRDAMDGGIPAWEHFSGAPILSSPTLDGGTLYITNVGGLVFALNAADGALKWRHAHKLDPARTAELELFGAPPAVIDPAHGQVLVGFHDGFLVGLSAPDGTPQWSAQVGEGSYPDIIAPPVVTGDTVYGGGFSEPLVAFSTVDRTVRWRLAVGSAAPYLLQDGTLWHGGTDGILRRIDARTGDVAWAWDSATSGTLGTPTLTPAGVLVASGEGSLYLLDADHGSLRWTFDPGVLLNGISAAPAIDGDTVYVVTNAGRLYALRSPRDGTVIDTPDWVTPATLR